LSEVECVSHVLARVTLTAAAGGHSGGYYGGLSDDAGATFDAAG
jgi:hypothetical protein